MLSQSPCGFFIKQIHDAMDRRANNDLRNQDLTISQIAVLIILNDSPSKSASLKELEYVLRIAQSTTAGIVARLEQKGFVEGYCDVSDKRVKIVRITTLGERCRLEAKVSMDLMEQNLLSSLTLDEQSIFYVLLQKVSNNIK